MRLGAGQASAKLAFLARLSATRGTADKQRLFLLGFHDPHDAGSLGRRLVNCDQRIHLDQRGEIVMAILISGCELSCSDAKACICHSNLTECVDGAANADSQLSFTGRCQQES